jgi:hypothetical protein
VAAGSYGAVAARPSGTYYASSGALASQGAYARSAYVEGGHAAAGYFSPSWATRYPSAWVAGRTTAAVAAPASWEAVAGFCGYPQQPSYYDYGGNVVSQPDAMYVNGDQAGTPQQYADQAGQIAGAGSDAPPDPNATWQPLGIFSVAPDDGSAPFEFFQLAINPKGVLRGNYHNSDGDRTDPISGSVDTKTLRAAWTIGDQKTPVFEAGIANLTKDETTMMVHGQGGQSKQFTLVRMPAPESADSPQGSPRAGQ